ncbi:hypothetical protein K402DRAFT_417113 [Aulographum hederae CBS 113979]|uniref:Uncharacterized protein n=1 Tax=Aulographum hederae CBS 113979 TaxID=1176131 RepID=A0A6G1HD91_9PEZI|nr:hypothetical protein K402DRAFT_417113 [Aulographum hederae CBS 113979]
MPPEAAVHPWQAHLKGLTTLVQSHNKQTGGLPGTGFFAALEISHNQSDWVVKNDTPLGGWFMDHSEHQSRDVYDEVIAQHAMRRGPVLKSKSTSASLDDLILRTTPILQRAPSLLESSHPEAKKDLELLFTAARDQLSSFKLWPSGLPEYWQPKTVHHQVDGSDLPWPGIFSGRTDMYSDLYVAAAWNTYRTTLLRLCDVILRCSIRLSTDAAPFDATDEHQTLHAIAVETCEGICASVPYHVDQDWLNRVSKTSFQKSSKALGGLFLIWPLYGGSLLSIVPRVFRAWMRQRLRAIGTSMGLAQAITLADTVDVWGAADPHKAMVIAEGYVFMWSASMFSNQ